MPSFSRFALPFLAVTLATFSGAIAFQAQPSAGDGITPRTVTVTASGSVRAVPDMVMISTGVRTTAETARQALRANSQTMQRVIERLREVGIRKRNIATDNLSVQPIYKRSRNNETPPVVTGYRVNNSVRIRVTEIALLGEVLDQVVDLGANQIGGIQFLVRKAERLRDDARTKAMENARRRARLFAREAGVDLGKVLMIREGNVGFSPQPRMMEMRQAQASVPVEAGSKELSAQVTVTWELR
ncbi:MAG: SIMPL domain-containing protein [Hyphomicrobiaceae bacterium]